VDHPHSFSLPCSLSKLDGVHFVGLTYLLCQEWDQEGQVDPADPADHLQEWDPADPADHLQE
jgi:hypothetical protein